MYNIITIGDIVIDTHIQIDDASLECKLKNKPCQLCFDYASKTPIKDSFQSLGGNAANVAVGVTKLGLTSTIISSIGDDSNGKLAIDELEKFNVNVENIAKDPKQQTRYSVVLNYQSERTILSFHGKRKYALPSKMPPTELIYFTGLSADYEKLQSQFLKWKQKHPSVTLIYNPGSYQIKNTMNEVKEMIKNTDILIVNLQEAEKILNTTLKEMKKVSALIHGLLNLGAHEVVITDSAKGAYVGDLDEVWYMPSFPVKVVAKVGAGDAFSSGYISARQKGHNKTQALRWGIANSSGVITKVGAQNGLLNTKQIHKILVKYENITPKIVS